MKKQILAASLTAALMLSMFAGCGNNAGGDTSGGGDDANKIPTEVDLYTYYADASIPVVDRALEQLKEKYPDLTINVEHRTDSDGTVLKTRAAVGELPDVFENTGNLAAIFAESGDLAPLDDLIESTGFYSKFDATAFDGKKIDGVTYATQVNKNEAYTIFYNKTVLADNGIEEPKNYDEFLAAVEKLVAADIIPLSLFAQQKWPGLQLFDLAVIGSGEITGLTGLEDGTTSITDPAYVEAAGKLQKLVDAGLVGNGALNTNASQAFELLKMGQAAFLGNGSWYFQDSIEYGDNIGFLEYNPFADAGDEETYKYAKSAGAPDISGYGAYAKGDYVEFSKQLALDFVEERHAAEYYNNAGVCRFLEAPETIAEMPESYAKYCESVPKFTSMSKYEWSLADAELIVALEDTTEKLIMKTTDSDGYISELDGLISALNLGQ